MTISGFLFCFEKYAKVEIDILKQQIDILKAEFLIAQKSW